MNIQFVVLALKQSKGIKKDKKKHLWELKPNQFWAGSLNRLAMPLTLPMPRPLTKLRFLNSDSMGDSRQVRFKDPAQIFKKTNFEILGISFFVCR